MLPAELSFLSPNSSHIVHNVSPLKCLIKYIATFLGSFNCPLIDIRKSDIDTLYFVQTTAIILSVSGANNRVTPLWAVQGVGIEKKRGSPRTIISGLCPYA
jgi:hypothetical protein